MFLEKNLNYSALYFQPDTQNLILKFFHVSRTYLMQCKTIKQTTFKKKENKIYKKVYANKKVYLNDKHDQFD